jgi:hypothetical protein
MDMSVLDVNRKDELISLQKADVSLTRLYEQVTVEPFPVSHSYYYCSEGVLMHCQLDKTRLRQFQQVVVPMVLRDKLLTVAHDIPAAGHLAVAKTLSRLTPHFFWPKLAKNVKEYCKTCDICQRVGKGPKPKVAPLIRVPVLSEPFTRIAIDVVGPLPKCKNTDNRFILTVIDLATHYPEAIALPNHTAQSVAKALVTVFSHFGFSREVLSDQGTDFQSDLMKIFLQDFGISHVTCSTHHPESNGCLERFHRTLKGMIRSLVDRFEDSWDECLPWVLFSYRECPVETLGFSPFELLYSYPVRGPLGLIKDMWLDGGDALFKAKPNVLSFMLDMRERLRVSRDLALDTANQSRSKAKKWYDKKARTRTFKPGDKVLILLPRPGHPLEAKFKGPYVVLDKVGQVDYHIATPGRRKPSRICHINMLKPYFERYEGEGSTVHLVFDPFPPVEPFQEIADPFLDITPDHFNLEHMSFEHRTELTTLLNSYETVSGEN